MAKEQITLDVINQLLEDLKPAMERLAYTEEKIISGLCPSCTNRVDVQLVDGICPRCDTNWVRLYNEGRENGKS